MNTQEAIEKLQSISCYTDEQYEALTHAIEHMKRWQWRKVYEESTDYDIAPRDVDLLLYCPNIHVSNPERVEVGLYKSIKSGTMHAWATHFMPLPDAPEVTK